MSSRDILNENPILENISAIQVGEIGTSECAEKSTCCPKGSSISKKKTFVEVLAKMQSFLLQKS